MPPWAMVQDEGGVVVRVAAHQAAGARVGVLAVEPVTGGDGRVLLAEAGAPVGVADVAPRRRLEHAAVGVVGGHREPVVHVAPVARTEAALRQVEACEHLVVQVVLEPGELADDAVPLGPVARHGHGVAHPVPEHDEAVDRRGAPIADGMLDEAAALLALAQGAVEEDGEAVVWHHCGPASPTPGRLST